MNEINIEWQQRTELLLGKDKMKRQRHAQVLVVGFLFFSSSTNITAS